MEGWFLGVAGFAGRSSLLITHIIFITVSPKVLATSPRFSKVFGLFLSLLFPRGFRYMSKVFLVFCLFLRTIFWCFVWLKPFQDRPIRVHFCLVLIGKAKFRQRSSSSSTGGL